MAVERFQTPAGGVVLWCTRSTRHFTEFAHFSEATRGRRSIPANIHVIRMEMPTKDSTTTLRFNFCPLWLMLISPERISFQVPLTSLR